MNHRHQSADRCPPRLLGRSAPPFVCAGPGPFSSRLVSVGRRRCAGHFCIDGESRLAFAVKVGSNDEDSSAEVRGADVGGRQLEGTASVSQVAELPPHRRQPSAHLGPGDVLDHDGLRSYSFDDASEVPPKRGPFPAEPSPGAGVGDVLAGEAAADEIHVGIVPGARDIVEPRDVGPVLREHRAAEWVDLALPDDVTETGLLKPELQSADAGKERPNPHFSTPSELGGTPWS